MFTVDVKIELYSIDELSEESRNKAIVSHRNFLLSVYSDDDYDAYGDYEEYEEGLDDDVVIDNIEANEYLYFKDGEMAYTIKYVGNKSETDKHVLVFNDEEYLLKD